MVYSCTRMATVDVKALSQLISCLLYNMPSLVERRWWMYCTLLSALVTFSVLKLWNSCDRGLVITACQTDVGNLLMIISLQTVLPVLCNLMPFRSFYPSISTVYPSAHLNATEIGALSPQKRSFKQHFIIIIDYWCILMQAKNCDRRTQRSLVHRLQCCDIKHVPLVCSIIT